jgi:hypothetical protein
LGNSSRTNTQRFEVAFRVLPARPGDAPLSVNPDWVDKIKVTLTLGYEVKPLAPARSRTAAARSGAPATAGTSPVTSGTGAATTAADAEAANFRFYRASATVLTMRRATQGSVFFYLPGEVIDRDRLPSVGANPLGLVANVEIAGKQGTPFYSRALKASKAQLDGFTELSARGVLDTVGILRNQNQVQGLDNRVLSPTLLAEEGR